MISFLRLPVRLLALIAALILPVAAFAQTAVGAGAGGGAGNPLVDALNWMMAILLGPVATSLAVMAVAGVGFMMLTGRMNWRYGGTVIVGVFIIFGAPRLVNSIAAF